MIYFDHAATSFPKAPGVVAAMRHYLEDVGANPGRSGYGLSATAARLVFDARAALARLLGAPDSRQIVFTQNATEALNQALYGWLRPGDHVVATAMEHNAVLRPLRHLVRTRGLRLELARCDELGRLDLTALKALVTPRTRLVVVNHASNVNGVIQPLSEIRAATGRATLLVDAAQTAGALPLDVERDGVDLLAVTGHKSLLGPPGTGALYLRPGLEDELEPLLRGGTGSRSEEEEQPAHLPDRFEGGTRNTCGLAGLAAAAAHLLREGVDNVRAREVALTARLLEGLARIPGLVIHGPSAPEAIMPVVSITLPGIDNGALGLALERRYGILVRIGLHCAPRAHRTLGTYPAGTVRLAPGYSTTPAEVDAVLAALAELQSEGPA